MGQECIKPLYHTHATIVPDPAYVLAQCVHLLGSIVHSHTVSHSVQSSAGSLTRTDVSAWGLQTTCVCVCNCPGVYQTDMTEGT